jgi:hypothetical protein
LPSRRVRNSGPARSSRLARKLEVLAAGRYDHAEAREQRPRFGGRKQNLENNPMHSSRWSPL